MHHFHWCFSIIFLETYLTHGLTIKIRTILFRKRRYSTMSSGQVKSTTLRNGYHQTPLFLVISTRTIRHGTQDRPLQEEKEWSTQSIDLNWNSPKRVPQNSEPSSPAVSLASTSLITSCSWQILSMLSSDHLPILIRLQMKMTTTPGLHQTYVNLKKAN